MEKMVELTKIEAIEINGGGSYDVGYKVGKFTADLADWFEGFADGFNDAFKNAE